MLQVLIYVTANPGEGSALRQILLEFAKKRCSEIGCRKCNLLQDTISPESFILVEEWGVQERLESRLSPDNLQDFFRESEDLLAEVPSIRWFQVVES